MLTLEQLKEMPPGEVFATGYVENSPEGIYMTDQNKSKQLLWAAKRGGIHDWAIYIYWADAGLSFVLSQGDKVTNSDDIKKLVPCNEEAFKMYRY